MKTVRSLLLGLLLALPQAAFAQANAHPMHAVTAPATASPSQQAFDALKSLAGSWVGQLKTFPADPRVDGRFSQVSMRVTSLGNAFVHELSVSGRPDHPVTMFYRDADRLTLVHYCDAGNRPRMTATSSPDRRTLDFEFLDLSGENTNGHMHHVTFTFVDEDHHIEDWTYMAPDNIPVRAHFELQRTNMGNPTN